MLILRQGDVLLKRVKSIPDGAKPVQRESGRIVLAYGEATGHAHAVMDEDVQLLIAGDHRFLEVKSPATLRHEEHGAVAIPSGKFEVIRQREYSPEEIRNVAD